MQMAKIGSNSLKSKQCLLRKGKIPHLLALGVLGLWWRREILRFLVLHLWVLLVQVRRKEEKEARWSFLEELKEKKEEEEDELDVLASRSKVWDPNLVCVYIFILCCCFGCDL